MRPCTSILVTGGAGFIGSNFIRFLFSQEDFTGTVINIDKLTYAGNRNNNDDIEQRYGQSGRYYFYHKDISDYSSLDHIINDHAVDTVIHFAAETHVDRSIFGPHDFIQTNIVGTFTLLEVARKVHVSGRKLHFHHISTDEVYGSLVDNGYFSESTPYAPRNPYSASKASADHLVASYFHTYGLPITISHSSNNYGPYQYPEKLIPLMIYSMLNGKPLPVYGDGKQIRDWLHVDDHNRAVWAIIQKGTDGEVFNIGAETEIENIVLVKTLCQLVAHYTGKPDKKYLSLITHVADRAGHDRRYAMDASKLRDRLKWEPKVEFKAGLASTVRWYIEHQEKM